MIRDRRGVIGQSYYSNPTECPKGPRVTSSHSWDVESEQVYDGYTINCLRDCGASIRWSNKDVEWMVASLAHVEIEEEPSLYD